MSNPISEDCSSGLHDYCTPCQCSCHGFGEINLDEARALNSLLRIHHGLFREMPEYIHLLRLINGLGTFVDQHDK